MPWRFHATGPEAPKQAPYRYDCDENVSPHYLGRLTLKDLSQEMFHERLVLSDGLMLVLRGELARSWKDEQWDRGCRRSGTMAGGEGMRTDILDHIEPLTTKTFFKPGA